MNSSNEDMSDAALLVSDRDQLGWLRKMFTGGLCSHFQEAMNLRGTPAQRKWEALAVKLFGPDDWHFDSIRMALSKELTDTEFEKLWYFFLEHTDQLHIPDAYYSLESKFRWLGREAHKTEKMSPVYISKMEVWELWDLCQMGDQAEQHSAVEEDNDTACSINALYRRMRLWSVDDFEDPDELGLMPVEALPKHLQHDMKRVFEAEDDFLEKFGPKVFDRDVERQRRRDAYLDEVRQKVKLSKETK